MSRPYAFIHDGMQHLSWFRDSLSASARIKFDQLNPDFSPNLAVMPGRLIIVGDQTTQMCTPEESQLMAYARDIHQSLIANDHASSRVVIHNYDLLQNIMSYSSIGIGSATSAWSSHLGQVEGTLKDIEAAYQRWRSGVLSKDQFIALRQKLFAILDDQLRGIGRFGTGLKNNSTIKRMLGISSKSYLHTGEITNYVKTLKRVNNVARKLSKGSVVGIALDLGAGALEIHEACSMGRKEMCTKAKFVEVGKMVVGIPAATAGGYTAATLCVRLAGPTRGASILVCGIAAGAAGGWLAGKGGSAFGDFAGTMLYELLGDE